MQKSREERLEDVLAQFIRPVKNIPFEIIIKSLCGVTIEKFDPKLHDNSLLLSSMTKAMRDACARVQKTPIRRPRPNEVGNDMEAFVIAALNAEGLVAAAPRTLSGKGKSTGYPDIRIERKKIPIYLEVKTYAAANHQTTQRSFYFSPAEDPKVVDDAYHLLVGFEMVREANLFKPVAYEIIDLYGLECDMKSEFNSDNRRLYQPVRQLAWERLPQN